MIEVGTQEKIVEFEILVFEDVETCVVTEFENNDTDELDVEIPTFMRGQFYVCNQCRRKEP